MSRPISIVATGKNLASGSDSVSRPVSVGATAQVIHSASISIARAISIVANGGRPVPATVSIGTVLTVTASAIVTRFRADIVMLRSVTATARNLVSGKVGILIGHVPPCAIVLGRVIQATPSLTWTSVCQIQIGLRGGYRSDIKTGISILATPKFRWAGITSIQRPLSVVAALGARYSSNQDTITLGRTVGAAGSVRRGSLIFTVLSGGVTAASERISVRSPAGIGARISIVANAEIRSNLLTPVALIFPAISVAAAIRARFSGQTGITRSLAVGANPGHSVLGVCNILTRCQITRSISAGIQMWLVGTPSIRLSEQATILTMGRTVTAAGRQRLTLLSAIALGRNISASVTISGASATILTLGRQVIGNPVLRAGLNDVVAIRAALVLGARKLISSSLNIGMRSTVVANGRNAAFPAATTIPMRLSIAVTGRNQLGISDLIQGRATVGASPFVTRNATIGIATRVSMAATVGGVATGSVVIGIRMALVGTPRVRIPLSVLVQGVGRFTANNPSILIRPQATVGIGSSLIATPKVLRRIQAGIGTRMSVGAFGTRVSIFGTTVAITLGTAIVNANGTISFLAGIRSNVRAGGPVGSVRSGPLVKEIKSL